MEEREYTLDDIIIEETKHLHELYYEEDGQQQSTSEEQFRKLYGYSKGQYPKTPIKGGWNRSHQYGAAADVAYPSYTGNKYPVYEVTDSTDNRGSGVGPMGPPGPPGPPGDTSALNKRIEELEKQVEELKDVVAWMREAFEEDE